MNIDDRVRLNTLYDYYRDLLTIRQKELFELYFQYDLSLGEIAANLQISRQAVYDLLRRATKQLNYYEERLQIASRQAIQRRKLADLEQALILKDIDTARHCLDQLKKI